MAVLEEREKLQRLGLPPDGRMVHYEHPDRHGEAWCGADVIGVRGRFGKVDCVVCCDLRDLSRRRS